MLRCSAPQAGHVTGDRLWRMPLYGQYTKQIQDKVANISNVGARGRYATNIINIFKICMIVHDIVHV
jgi:leucyl aminopeptidase